MKSFGKMQLFAAGTDQYLKRVGKADTITQHNLNRVLDQVRKYQESIQVKLTDIEIDTCVVNQKDVIQRDEFGNLCFTRDGLKERNRLQKELIEREDLELEPYYLDHAPVDAWPAELEAWSGFVLRPSHPVEFVNADQEGESDPNGSGPSN